MGMGMGMSTGTKICSCLSSCENQRQSQSQRQRWHLSPTHFLPESQWVIIAAVSGHVSVSNSNIAPDSVSVSASASAAVPVTDLKGAAVPVSNLEGTTVTVTDPGVSQFLYLFLVPFQILVCFQLLFVVIPRFGSVESITPLSVLTDFALSCLALLVLHHTFWPDSGL